ncbi:MAG: DUF2207 domain-containing protein [Proteobacteria bacterium]|nr:MAG: DUF2207 domain-containing protein [Pseudomonadota bacterium]QKK10811.1 MAG: DUF2207 domain-containing protein [Pseudomonadota bacterium]
MKRCLGMLVLVLGFVHAASAREQILSFHSDIQVFPDASMVVTETIRVKAEGQEIKRGIYRDFPTDYKDRFGNRYRVDFSVAEVLRDGNPEDYHTQRQGNGVRVYIGHKDRYLRAGVYTYTLRYRTDRQLGFFQDHDEIYWNVTGNDWVFPILAASAAVRLPTTIPADALKPEGYTGFRGDQRQDYEAVVDYDGTVRFSSTRSFAPREGLTIVVAWPKGYIAEPSTEEKLWYLLRDNVPYLIGAVGLTLLLIFYLSIWHRYGRDPESGVIIPRYEPPEGYSPASTRFVQRMGYDHKTFAAALVNLAVKGLVEIHEKGKDFVLLRTSKEADDLAPGEKALIRALFVSTKPSASKSRELEKLLEELRDKGNKLSLIPRLFVHILQQRVDTFGSDEPAPVDEGTSNYIDSVVLERKNHSRIRSALSAHEAVLKRDHDKIYFRTNTGWMVPGVIITLLTLAGTALTLEGEEMMVGLFMSVWLSFWSIGVIVLLRQAWGAWRGARSVLEWISALFASAFALPFLAGEVAGFYLLFTQGSPAILVILVLGIVINVLFFQLLKAPTRAGRKLLDKAEGLKLYLEVAEKDEMNFRNPPEKTPELFERFLPYALALGVENQWAERFSGLFQKLGREGHEYQPGWYHGRHWNPSNMGTFSTAIGGSLGSALSSSSTAPGSSSSGSGGGGSSGGGGGGGGGGGW